MMEEHHHMCRMTKEPALKVTLRVQECYPLMEPHCLMVERVRPWNAPSRIFFRATSGHQKWFCFKVSSQSTQPSRPMHASLYPSFLYCDYFSSERTFLSLSLHSWRQSSPKQSKCKDQGLLRINKTGPVPWPMSQL